MQDTPDADRRLVLRALASLVPLIACARTTSTLPEPPRALPAVFPEALAVLGRHYLAAHPEDDDREALRHALGLDDAQPESSWLAHLDASLHRDLERGDIIELEGWQLTRTECRLYALAALG